jgi:ORF6N domain
LRSFHRGPLWRFFPTELISDRRFHIVRSPQELFDECRLLLKLENFVGTDLPALWTSGYATRMAVGRTALGKLEDITRAIPVLRGRRVHLDAELAVLYGATMRRLNEQERRNRKRFPDDFLFELTTEEFANLKSRFATSSWGGRLKRPLAFTEHGAIQAATILNSGRRWLGLAVVSHVALSV